MYLSGVAARLLSDCTVSITDIISHCLMEVLGNYLTDETQPKLKLKQVPVDPNELSSITYSLQTLTNVDNNDIIIVPNDEFLCYIINSYNRVHLEERRFPRKSTITPLNEALADVRKQLIWHLVLYLTSPSVMNGPGSILLDPLLSDSFPDDFLQEIVSETFLAEDDCFGKIFNPLLIDLYCRMQEVSILDDDHRLILQGLSHLLDLGWKSYPNVRPIATLIVQHSMFFPEMFTEAPGREIAKTTFFSPFLNLSIFSDEVPELGDRYFATSTPCRSEVSVLQLKLETSRTFLHKIFHSILVNTASRDLVLDYIGAILNFNEKRAQMQSTERLLATDGFMLNVLVLLQQLAVRIQLDKVDFMYIFDPNCIVDINDTTRLKLTTKEYSEWIASLSK